MRLERMLPTPGIIVLALMVSVTFPSLRANECERQSCLSDHPWGSVLIRLLSEFKQCREALDDRSPCNTFLTKALATVYQVEDFGGGSTTSFSANQIAARLTQIPGLWEPLGAADRQSALDQAVAKANAGLAVIAVWQGTPHGHVALILPGATTRSGSWGLQTPCAASFFLDNPQKAFVGCPLSYAFSSDKKQDVRLYARRF